MPFDPDDGVYLYQVDARRWQLCADVTYRGAMQTFTVPAGYVTDLTSSPRITHFIAPVSGNHSRASVLHDWLITHGIPAGIVSSIDTDGLYRRVLRECGVPPVKQWIWWAGVRWGALGSKTRRPGWWRTFPRLLLVTLGPCMIFVFIPALVNAVFLVLYGAAELVVTRGKSWGTWRT